MGSWLTYGLGTENQNLPGFVVLCPGLPVLGHALWSSTFLPAVHQGTYIPLGEKDPKKLIEHIRNPRLTEDEQRQELDLLGEAESESTWNAKAAIPNWRRAFSPPRSPIRMQKEAPDAFDITQGTRSRFARAMAMAISREAV